MKPETERLLQQCRATLLQYSAEQLNTLFVSWFERMVGEETMDEDLDDLCLLLGYGIRSEHSNILYATYTAWWEVEGSLDADGEFVCLDLASLQHQLITMPVKQFQLIAELAYQVCVQDAKTDNQPCPPTGHEWLRALAAWLSIGAQEPFYKGTWRQELPTPSLPPQKPPQQPTSKQQRSQQRKIESRLVDQAWQRGYLLLEPDVNNQVVQHVQNRCKKSRRPYICVQKMESQFATIQVDLSTIRKIYEAEGKLFSGAPEPNFTPTDEMRQRLTAFSEQYKATPEMSYIEPFTLSPRSDIFMLDHVLQENVPQAVQGFMALWPEILKQYNVQLDARRAAYEARQRELEEERKPAWLKAITRLSAQGPKTSDHTTEAPLPLPADWPSLLSKEQLGAFLTFLKLPASSREIKANLVQHLSTHLETDKNAQALLFEIFAIELAVPPWELETLLKCTTTERKRWTEENKLPVLGHGSFRKAGSDHEYPFYDRRFILSLTSSDIELWRNEHQELVRERRRNSAREAAARKKAQSNEKQLIHDK